MTDARADAINRELGRKIRKARELARLTQAQLGARIGMRFQQIQKYESGANNISGARLVQVARALELPMGWFVADMPEHDQLEAGEAGAELSLLLRDEELAGLVESVGGLKTPALRRRVVQFAKSLAEDGL